VHGGGAPGFAPLAPEWPGRTPACHTGYLVVPCSATAGAGTLPECHARKGACVACTFIGWKVEGWGPVSSLQPVQLRGGGC
jgi:hypothetical protein